jgi:hypothetical protein
MLEKTGNVVLTEEELITVKRGTMPKRILNEWGLSLSELQSIIASGSYKTIGTSSTDSPDNF